MTVTLTRGEADPVDAVASRLDAFLAGAEAALIEFRRDLHAHPELGNTEFRTTQLIADQLLAAGLAPRVLPAGTGLVCDIGQGEYGQGEYGQREYVPGEYGRRGGRLGIRADIDALPIQETAHLPFRSVNPGISHACGHDVHATAVLGAGLFLAAEARSGHLVRPVRLLFQPADRKSVV